MAALLWLAANVIMVIFIIKTLKEKEPNKKKKVRMIWLISLGVAVIMFFVVAAQGKKLREENGEVQQAESSVTEEAVETQTVEDVNVTEPEETTEVAKPDEGGDESSELEALREELKKNYDVSEPMKFVRDNSDSDHWRIVKVANATDPVDYALDYAKAYMKDGDIHYIVNFSLKTTTEFRLAQGKLSVKTFEYVDDEEHDASIIGQGMIYKETYFDMESGKEITTDADTNAGTADSDNLISTVEEAITGDIGVGEKITGVTFDGTNLTVTVDLSGADTKVSTAKELAELRISSITDDILELDDKYYNTWQTITMDFGTEGKAVLDKSMVVDQGFGKYFDFPEGMLK